LPPTDLMKILSRTDQLKKDFVAFLKALSLEREIQNGILNMFPYTTSIIIDKKPLQCLGMFSCVKEKFNTHSLSSSTFRYNGFIMELPRNTELVCIENTNNTLCKVYNVQGLVSIYHREGLRELIIITTSPLRLQKLPANVFKEVRSVKAITVISSNGLALTVSFDDLSRLVSLSRNHIMLEHYGHHMYISNEIITQSVRRAIVEKHIIMLGASINECHSTPLIETLDNYTLLFPWMFERNCVSMLAINITSEALNAIVKVYKGLITRVVVNEVEHVYRHRIIRFALAPHAISYTKLCLTPL